MGSCHQGQAIVVVERLRNVLSKCVARTTRGYSPTAPVIRVRPEEVAHGPLVRHLLDTIEGTDVVEGINTRRQPSVQAEDLIIDQGSKREVVEEVCEVLPDIRIAILSQAFVIEAVDLGNLARLVVTSKDCDALGVSDLKRNKKCYCFDGEVATIDVVPCTTSVGWPSLDTSVCIPMNK